MIANPSSWAREELVLEKRLQNPCLVVEPANPSTEKRLPPLTPQPQVNQEQSNDKMHSCDLCPVFYKFDLLKNHMMNKHFIRIKDLIKCGMCPKSFDAVKKLNRHKKSHK